MKRRILSALLALVMVLGLTANVSAAPDTITSGDWTYRISEGKAVLCSYNGTDTEIVVPATIDGYAVSELGPGAFRAFGSVAETMTSVTLSEGIEIINTNAFKNCTALQEATIPGSVRWIGSYAFYGCTALTDLYLQEGTRTINSYAFANTGLALVVIPASVTDIGDKTFGYAGEWGDEEQIDGFAIFGWSGSDAQEYARDWHFTFYRLEDMTDTSGRCGDDATWRFEESTGTLYIEGEDDTDPYYNCIAPWIAHCEQIRKVVIGEGIDHLGDSTFAYFYPNLTKLELPESMRSLGNAAFRGCTGLTAVNLPAKLTWIYGHTFDNTGLTAIELPSPMSTYSSYLGGGAFANCADLQTIRFTGNPWDIADNAFQNITVAAWYPVDNTAWTDYYLQQYGGNVTWNAYDPDLFVDVAVGSFYHESVVWAVANDITKGITDTTFCPTTACNRAQVVTFLWRAAGCPEPTVTEHGFVDVNPGSFYAKAVLWALENGITKGTDSSHFSPDMTCDRATVVTFLYRAFGSPEVSTTESDFTDVPSDRWFSAAIEWAVANGITKGLTADTFGPNEGCNRGQVVTFLHRAYTE